MTDAKTLCDQARAHWGARRFDEAQALYDRVLADDPKSVAAIEGLGLVALNRGEVGSAEVLFGQALAIDPNRLGAQASLAEIYKDAGRFHEARALAENVLARRPDLMNVQFLLAEILWALDEPQEAFRLFAAPCSTSPEFAGHLETLIFERLNAADWRGYETEKTFLEKRIRAGRDLWQDILPMLMLSEAREIAQAARTCAAQRYPARPPLSSPRRWGHDRIRIGYLTAELYDHPVGHLMAAVLEHHDRSRFEIVGFSYGPDLQDEVYQRLAPNFDTLLPLTTADDQAIARAVREREIDIAVTLNGYAYNARPGILAHRPAPVQVNYLGFPGTMGAPYIDYLIADRQVIPESESGLYSEKIAWMPDSYQPTDNRAQVAETPTRVGEGLPDKAFVYMAYSQTCRISPATFDLWMRVLLRVEGSVLWLSAGTEASRENLRRQAAAHEVGPERLVFAGRKERRSEHLARHRLADLFLDTLPYNAHSTASDALWAGLPVISQRGTTFPGRVCSGLLTVAGLRDLVTSSPAEYEDLAVALALDPSRLAQVRQRVEGDARASALFDTARYVRHLESAFQTMHQTALAGEPPRAFAVERQAG